MNWRGKIRQLNRPDLEDEKFGEEMVTFKNSDGLN
jgi:hypothetical protein